MPDLQGEMEEMKLKRSKRKSEWRKKEQIFKEYSRKIAMCLLLANDGDGDGVR